MNSFRSIFAGSLLVCIMVAAPMSSLDARHGHEGWGPPPEPPMHFNDPEYLKEELGLSDSQIDAVGRINRAHHTRMVALNNQLKPKTRELRRLLGTDPVDLNAVKNILREIGLVEADIRFERISHHMDIEKILTPEQREKLRRERHRMPPPPPPPGYPEGEGPDD